MMKKAPCRSDFEHLLSSRFKLDARRVGGTSPSGDVECKAKASLKGNGPLREHLGYCPPRDVVT